MEGGGGRGRDGWSAIINVRGTALSPLIRDACRVKSNSEQTDRRRKRNIGRCTGRGRENAQSCSSPPSHHSSLYDSICDGPAFLVLIAILVKSINDCSFGDLVMRCFVLFCIIFFLSIFIIDPLLEE